MNEELDAAAEIDIEAGAGGEQAKPAAKTAASNAANAKEGAVVNPTTAAVAKMYKELGITAPAPTGATKGRPKSSTVRAEDASTDANADTKPGRKDDNASADESKNAPIAAKNGDSGDNSDAKGAKVGQASGEVSDESEEADAGVRDAKSAAKGDSERGSEEDALEGDNGTGQETDESDDSEEEGKRPGKSNPKVEQRFQRLTEEKRERDELIEKLQRELQETTQKQQQAQIAQEDPEYTIDDFRKVRDEEGNILDLDPERAELAWRRWKEGYDQRATERQAAQQHELAQEQRASQMSEQIMRQSVEAYDTLAGLMDEYPQLVSTSGQFDQEFAAVAMPIIQDAIIYQPGTEPGNAQGATPIIMGMKINPKQILAAMTRIKDAKRSLPLNGTNDNVEARSNVSVSHSRSSDPTVNAANELMKELKINKRF